MPTMNAPPPAAQPPPPVFSPPTNKSYRSKRNEELEAIRRKGLTTIFNKHFTSAADKYRQERKAADMALMEIVRRKAEVAANPKSFEGGLTMTQLDKLHMEIKKRKSEALKKERETVELWRRYCSQYGDINVNETSAGSNGMHLKSMVSGVNQDVDDDMSIVRQSDLKHKDIIPISGDVKEIKEQYEDGTAFGYKENSQNKSTSTATATAFATTWKRPEGLMAVEPLSLVPLVQKMSAPPAKTIIQPDAIAPLTSITPVKSVISSSPRGNHVSFTPMKLVMDGFTRTKQGAVVETSPNIVTVMSTPPPMSNQKTENGVLRRDDWCNGSVMDRTVYLNETHDDESCISGITEIDGATVAEAEWRLTEFLRTERENMKKMFHDEPTIEECGTQEEDYSNSLFSSSYNGRSAMSSYRNAKAVQDAEAMVKQMQEDTKWLNDPMYLKESYESKEQDNQQEGNGLLEYNNDLEWKAYWSEEHKREYYHNVTTNQTCWTRPKGVQVDFKAVIKANPQADIQVEEKNVAFTDETPTEEERVDVKDFTKKVGVSPFYATNAEMIHEFRPQRGDTSIQSRSSSTKTSKVMMYRRRRAMRQRRNRRIAIAIFCVAIGVALYFYKNSSYVSNRDQKSVVLVPSQIDIEEQIKLEVAKKLEEEIIRREAFEAAEEERRRQEEEIMRREEEIAAAKLEMEILEAEEANRIRMEQEAQVAWQDIASKELALQEEALKRPWACNIPLAYLISRRCWTVAKKNPVFDLKALTDAMME